MSRPGTTKREQLERAIAALEAQRAALGDAVVETALGSLRQQLDALDTQGAAPELKGERKLVTVMFADISGFTTLAERLDPEAVRDLMNACFEQLVPIVERYGGTVDKFIGDEIMALFGAPVTHENDPERALRAALDMMAALETFNAQRSTDLALHFGINTGLVVAGGLGTHERQEYTVMGDTVNVASRLEEISEGGEILVGSDTYRLTAPLFDFERLETLPIAGKAEPVPVYRLLRSKPLPGKVRGIAGLISPLIGREAEFGALRDAVGRVQGGEGGIVPLIGEAGLGKSRLVAEVRQQTDVEVRWVEGRCVSYGSSVAYLLWLDLLRALLGVTAEDPPLTVLDALRKRIQTLCPAHFEEVFLYLSWLMSLPMTAEDEATVRELEGERRKSAIFGAVKSLVESMTVAQKPPLVIVCEDLHWADPTSIELLEYLFQLVDRLPLLFICISRPVREHSSWRIQESAKLRGSDAEISEPGFARVLRLKPLSVTESRFLVGSLLHVEALPPKLRDRILGRAEGNPFYIEEIIRSLMDSGDITRDGADEPSTLGGAIRWRATREVDEIVIPDTLRGVLMARVDRLPQETKRVLQLASVLGRIFARSLLVEVAQEEQTLGHQLVALQQEGMIRERKQTYDPEYIFKHQLTRQAAYDSLLKKERRAYHRRAAEALKRLFPDRLKEYAALLGHHWEQAGEIRHAIPHLIRAGELALSNFASAEAEDYLSRALVFARKTGLTLAEADALHDLSYVSRYQGDYAQARVYLEQALDIYRGMSNRMREGMLLTDFGIISLHQRNYREARAYFEQALHIYRLIKSRRGETSALNRLGGVCQDQGDYTEARDCFERALSISRGMRNRWSEARSLGNLGNICRDLGDHTRAAAYLEHALRLSRDLKSQRMEGSTLSSLSLLCHRRGDDETACEYARQALQIFRDIGHHFAQGRALVSLGHALAALGHLEESADAYQQALILQRDLNKRYRAMESLAGLANVSLEQGALSEARSRVEEILEHLGDDKIDALYGAVEPFRVYLTCYRVLRANQDPRARDILGQAHSFLQERAAGIDDEGLRRSFLEKVTVHRQIVQAFAGGQAGGRRS